MAKTTRIMIYVFAIAVLSVTCHASEDILSPNVILVLTDDLGYSDIGCYGATKVKTPNIDGLAAVGIRFTDFHTAASICSPSRAAFLTGAYPQRAGLYMAESENLSVEHPEVVQRILTLATETRQELGEFMQRGSGQRRTGSVVPGAPVISHEKDWGMVDAATVEAIAKERQRRYPAGKKRKGIRE